MWNRECLFMAFLSTSGSKLLKFFLHFYLFYFRLKTMKETIKALLSPSTLKPFGILAVYFFVYQWCGVNTITFYAVEVFEVINATS